MADSSSLTSSHRFQLVVAIQIIQFFSRLWLHNTIKNRSSIQMTSPTRGHQPSDGERRRWANSARIPKGYRRIPCEDSIKSLELGGTSTWGTDWLACQRKTSEAASGLVAGGVPTRDHRGRWRHRGGAVASPGPSDDNSPAPAVSTLRWIDVSQDWFHELSKKPPAFLENLETKKIILVHGEGFGAWCWYKTMSLLEESGLLPVALDLTGSGIDQTDINSITSLEDYTRPLITYLQSLPDDEEVILVGHSCGGAIVSYALDSYPRKISKAVYVCATMVLNGQKPFYVFSEEDVALPTVTMRLIPLAPITEKLSLTTENYGTVRRYFIQTLDVRILSKKDWSVKTPLMACTRSKIPLEDTLNDPS